jgi:hypothetical protein
MNPSELEKWASQIDFSSICDGGKFHIMLTPGDFWEYIEQGGKLKESVVIEGAELSLLPVYDQQVLNFFHISSKHCSLLCQHDFKEFKRVYGLQGGSLDY